MKTKIIKFIKDQNLHYCEKREREEFNFSNIILGLFFGKNQLFGEIF